MVLSYSLHRPPFDKVLGVSNIKNLKYEWIWRKPQGTGHLNAKKMPLKNHENILVFYASPPNIIHNLEKENLILARVVGVVVIMESKYQW